MYEMTSFVTKMRCSTILIQSQKMEPPVVSCQFLESQLAFIWKFHDGYCVISRCFFIKYFSAIFPDSQSIQILSLQVMHNVLPFHCFLLTHKANRPVCATCGCQHEMTSMFGHQLDLEETICTQACS